MPLSDVQTQVHHKEGCFFCRVDSMLRETWNSKRMSSTEENATRRKWQTVEIRSFSTGTLARADPVDHNIPSHRDLSPPHDFQPKFLPLHPSCFTALPGAILRRTAMTKK